MFNKIGKSNIRKPLLILAGFFAFLLLTLGGIQWWLGHKALQLLTNETNQLKQGLHVEVGNFKVNLLTRSIVLESMTIQADSSLYEAKDSLFGKIDLKIDRLAVNGIRIKRAKGERLFQVMGIELLSPHLVMQRNERDSVSTDTVVSASKFLPEKLAVLFQKLSIGYIQIRDGSVEYNTWQAKQKRTYSIEGIHLLSENFGVDSLNGERFFVTQGLRLSVAHMGYTFNHQAEHLEVDSLELDSKSSMLSVSSVKLTPAYDKETFALKTPHHSDWTTMQSGRIFCQGFDVAELLRSHSVVADTLSLQDITLHSYKNRQLEQPKELKPLFFESLQNAPFGIDIHELKLENLNVVYEELPLLANKSAKITFNNISGTITHLNNRISSNQSKMLMHAQGKFMNSAPIVADFVFPSAPSNKNFEIKGRMGQFNLTDFNKVVQPLENIQVNSGLIYSLDFYIQGNDEHSSVYLTMLYQDLSITLMRRNKDVERKFLSFLADRFILQDQNPNPKGVVRTAAGVTIRDPYRSEFNYWWRSLLPGIEHTLTSRKSGSSGKKRSS